MNNELKKLILSFVPRRWRKVFAHFWGAVAYFDMIENRRKGLEIEETLESLLIDSRNGVKPS